LEEKENLALRMSKLWHFSEASTTDHVRDFGDTVHGMFWTAVEQRADQVFARQKALGIWQEWTWRETGDIVRDLAMGLAALDVAPGDCVSILANTSVEWVWCDLAALSAGGISNGIYPTDAASQVAYVCEDSRTVVLVVEDEEQLDKALSVRGSLPDLRHIVVIDETGLADFKDPMVMGLARLREMGAARLAQDPATFTLRLKSRTADDVGILVYTSGTTGRPKGVMQSHQGLIAGTQGALFAMPQDGRDERICFLPLCHVAERVLGLYVCILSGARMNFVENPDTVPENIREIAPTVLFGVPRSWEKFHSAHAIALGEAGWIQRKAYEWAIGIGYRVADRFLAGRPIPLWLRGLQGVAGLMGLNHVRQFIGIHRSRFLVTAAAPISPDLIRWYLALGIPMLEAWGQTECAGVATCTRPSAIKPGTVGQPSPMTEVRVAPDTGELLVRGPHVFIGYLNQPELFAQTVDADGWLHTGDVGTMDEAGFVRITDRMKDIIITAGGKNITPSEWENELKFSSYVTDAVVIGDRRAYLTAIVMIDQENVEKFAQDRDIAFTNYTSLTRAPEVLALIQGEIDKVNTRFARVEQIKRFFLLETQLSAEDEELTPTMKLKRKLVQTKYADRIEAMYR
jgi:long-chain acyl-CoA synthetase